MNKLCINVVDVGQGQMSLSFSYKFKARDECTDYTRQYHKRKTTIVHQERYNYYQEQVACPRCGAMISRVRMETHNTSKACKHNSLLATSQTTQSITYRYSDGSL